MLNKNEIIEGIERTIEYYEGAEAYSVEHFSMIDGETIGALKALKSLLVVINDSPWCTAQDIVIEIEARIKTYDKYENKELNSFKYGNINNLNDEKEALKELLEYIRDGF